MVAMRLWQPVTIWDDEAAVLMSNVLHWQTGYLARQAPRSSSHPGLAKK